MHGAAAYIHATYTSDANSHLRRAGSTGFPVSPEPQLVEVALVHRNGAAALTSHYKVEILLLPGLISPPEPFVSPGRQFHRLASCTELESGDLPSVTSATLLQMSIVDLLRDFPPSGHH